MKQNTPAIQRFALLILLFIAGAASLQAQQKESKEDKKAAKAAAITQLVTSQNYVFKAQTVIPMGGGTRNLTSDYDVRIAKDTVVSFLPYFGRAYSAVDVNNGGIQFTSTKFEYTAKDKKDGWDILIKPSDAKGVQQFNLSVFTNGTAMLQVSSINRQPISFNGYITAYEPRKKKK